MADQEHPVVPRREVTHLAVHLGDERAGGVDRLQATVDRVLTNVRRDAVGGEDHATPGGHLVELLDEHRAAPGQVGDDVRVVDDVAADVDRRAVPLERPLDDGDRSFDAGAEAHAVRRASPGAGARRSPTGRARAWLPAANGRRARRSTADVARTARASVCRSPPARPRSPHVGAVVPSVPSNSHADSMSTASAPAACKAVRSNPLASRSTECTGPTCARSPARRSAPASIAAPGKFAHVSARTLHGRCDNEIARLEARIDGAAEPDDRGRSMLGNDWIEALPRALAAPPPVSRDDHRRRRPARGQRLEPQRREQEDVVHRAASARGSARVPKPGRPAGRGGS